MSETVISVDMYSMCVCVYMSVFECANIPYQSNVLDTLN